MVEEVGTEEEIGEKMKDDEELEMLLDEIPQATSFNLHHPRSNSDHYVKVSHGQESLLTQSMNGPMNDMYDNDSSNHSKYTCASPVSGFSLQSDGSSSSLFSGGHSLSDNGSPTPPILEEVYKSHMFSESSHQPNGSWLDSNTPNLFVGKKVDENMIDELSLSRNLSRMYLGDKQEDISVGRIGLQFCDPRFHGTNPINSEKHSDSGAYRKGYSDVGGVQSSVPISPMRFDGGMNSALLHEYRLGNLSGSRYSHVQSDGLFSQLSHGNRPMSFPCHIIKDQTGRCNHRGLPVSNLATSPTASSISDALFSQQYGKTLTEGRGTFHSINKPQLTNPRPQFGVPDMLHYCPPLLNGRHKASLNVRVPQAGFEAFTREDGLIIQGEGLNYVINRGCGRSMGYYNKGSLHDLGVGKPPEKRPQLESRSCVGVHENGRPMKLCCPLSLPLKCNSLAEVQGHIYLIAKDQHGCRFLQRMFDEGTKQDMQIIFNEIIEHMVELMMNPFGNYLMQKLLETCSEEQRMQILFKVTEKPGELVRISLNTHGTRVVQKMIETLKIKQQISLVIGALEPGFLALIKDLNGNHVVQRCLQCFSNDDNKFIFVAAAKYCVDIATHQHGCCVLQRCISHSTGEHRENLVAEISANGLKLAQDPFGNYVVQFILELKISTSASRLISQFEGNFVHLSTQKFSSHVVEKCLVALNEEVRSKIVHELVSASRFEQLLQDPHANYVVQTALRVSKGRLHNMLVDAIESHKAISRNSPYSKRIFSHKLLKK